MAVLKHRDNNRNIQTDISYITPICRESAWQTISIINRSVCISTEENMPTYLHITSHVGK